MMNLLFCLWICGVKLGSYAQGYLTPREKGLLNPGRRAT